tara:strand:+ start:177 stop:350 length:174 start_codon:yes stop_codon:yes gene_type:complete
MDKHIQDDTNNPINWNGKEAIICTMCHTILNDEEIKQSDDDPNPYCFECIKEQERSK